MKKGNRGVMTVDEKKQHGLTTWIVNQSTRTDFSGTSTHTLSLSLSSLFTTSSTNQNLFSITSSCEADVGV